MARACNKIIGRNFKELFTAGLFHIVVEEFWLIFLNIIALLLYLGQELIVAQTASD